MLTVVDDSWHIFIILWICKIKIFIVKVLGGGDSVFVKLSLIIELVIEIKSTWFFTFLCRFDVDPFCLYHMLSNKWTPPENCIFDP